MTAENAKPTPDASQFPDSLMTMGDLEEIFEEPSTGMADIGASIGSDASVKCRFSFVCDRRLEDLTSTPDTAEGGAKLHRDKCQRQVVDCWTPEEAARAIEAKQCVVLMFSHRRA